MRRTIGITTLVAALALLVSGCKRAESQKPAKPEAGAAAKSETGAVAKPAAGAASKPAHVHADGSVHADHEGDHGEGEDHAHDEVALGTVTIEDMNVELAQGHGKVAAGKESHLVVKLPYNDKGQTIVRAWLGTEDRLKSVVGKGSYAVSHDDYDIHAMAPTPLPENVMWWIEIEKPDGTKALGSAKPILD